MNPSKPLRVAIVGCGKIADAHAAQITRVPQGQMVAACDSELLMARQFCERFRVPQAFAEVGTMIEQARPDVVHITTPPGSHFSLGKTCLQRGCHVYMEKPFTVTAAETDELLALAQRLNLKMTAGHDLQFSTVGQRLRALVDQGYLGGPAVHMESHYCYDLSDPNYAKAFLANRNHWLRRLPGKLLHNVISHGIARIAAFLTGDSHVIAHGFVSPRLRSLGEAELVDELRVIIHDGSGQTAYFTFSSQMRPSINQFRVNGPRNGLFLDEDQQCLLKLRGDRFKSYAEKFLPSMLFAGQHLKNVKTNLGRFLAHDFHMKNGMKCLIQALYGSILEATPVPIPYRQISLTANIMDTVFNQLAQHHSPSKLPCATPRREEALVVSA